MENDLFSHLGEIYLFTFTIHQIIVYLKIDRIHLASLTLPASPPTHHRLIFLLFFFIFLPLSLWIINAEREGYEN
jgi:hypothetical protein